jgi:hypothetical protein
VTKVKLLVLGATGARLSHALWFALGVACLLLVGAFWQWVLIDWLTPFVFPILALCGAGLMASSVVTSVFALVSRFRRGQGLDLGPLAVNLIAIALWLFVPFTRLWLEADYRWHRSARIEVVAQVRSGALTPNVADNAKLIKLSGSGSL